MNQNPFLKPVAILIGVIGAMYVVGSFFAPKDPVATPTADAASPQPVKVDPKMLALGPKAVKLPDGLQYEDLVVGTGAEAKNGKSIEVHYTGWLTNGMKFDSSHDRNEPYPLTLPGQVIAGWNEGILGMKAGGKRRLIIPPALGYGAQGKEPIPGNATLVFEIELLKVN